MVSTARARCFLPSLGPGPDSSSVLCLPQEGKLRHGAEEGTTQEKVLQTALGPQLQV